MREIERKGKIDNYRNQFGRLLGDLKRVKEKGGILTRSQYKKIFDWSDQILETLNRLDHKNEVPVKDTEDELIEIMEILFKRAESLSKKKMSLSQQDLDTINDLFSLMKTFPFKLEQEIRRLNKLLTEMERKKREEVREQELKQELQKGPESRTAKRDIKIYLDMDSCITDFDKAVKKLGSKAAKGLKDGASEEEVQFMYDKIEEAGSKFWSEMEWYPKGQELWSVIKKYNPVLLSSPGKFKWAPAGKQNWVSINLPGVTLFLEMNKYIYAEPDAILIDDKSSNIESWKEAGGLGILYEDNPESVKKQLQKIQKLP
jgi:hypothetical protein